MGLFRDGLTYLFDFGMKVLNDYDNKRFTEETEKISLLEKELAKKDEQIDSLQKLMSQGEDVPSDEEVMKVHRQRYILEKELNETIVKRKGYR